MQIDVGFHIEELGKIRKASKGLFRGSTRSAISSTLANTQIGLKQALLLNGPERMKSLTEQLVEKSTTRQRLVRAGAGSYSDPQWAGTAASESWISLVIAEENGSVTASARESYRDLIQQLF
jgi:hypothetical protein